MNFFYLSYLRFFYLIFANVEAKFNLPSFLHSCSKSDPNLNCCMISNAEALLPEIINGNETLHIPNLNPLTIPKLLIKEGNKQIGLNMAVRDIRVYRIDTMKATELELNMNDRFMKVRSLLQRLEIFGMHKTTSNILVVEVQGEGKFNITADKILLIFILSIDFYLKKK